MDISHGLNPSDADFSEKLSMKVLNSLRSLNTSLGEVRDSVAKIDLIAHSSLRGGSVMTITPGGGPIDRKLGHAQPSLQSKSAKDAASQRQQQSTSSGSSSGGSAQADAQASQGPDQQQHPPQPASGSSTATAEALAAATAAATAAAAAEAALKSRVASLEELLRRTCVGVASAGGVSGIDGSTWSQLQQVLCPRAVVAVAAS